MTARKAATQAASKDKGETTGLRLVGIAKERARNYVPKDNPTTEVVTYTIVDGSGRSYRLRDYDPTSYFKVGEEVDVPVYIRPYQADKGLSYTINLQKPRKNSGEHF